MNKTQRENAYRYGSLPDPAPLAAAYIPMQESAEPAYETGKALARGTLFPGLDLPFMNLVNDELSSTPLTEMMAIDFVTDELELYLDTHADDEEAFALYQTFLLMKQEAHERYVQRCGIVRQEDMLGMNEYAWLKDPWPWDYSPRRGG